MPGIDVEFCTRARMNCLEQVTVTGRKCEVWKLGKQLK
jgi:hypothetical protein